MNFTYYTLEKPVEKVIRQEITKYRIDNVNVTPFQMATITCILCDNDDKFIEAKNFFMEGEDYANWNNNDLYLINWLNVKIENIYNLNV